MSQPFHNLCKETNRNFGDSALQFYSLRLWTPSLEAIYWIMLTIRADRMCPTDYLIHSRLKEFFDLKINMKSWKAFTSGYGKIYSHKFLNKFKSFFWEIEIRPIDDLSSGFFFKNDDWDYEDLSPVSADSGEYLAFEQFINDYFARMPQASETHISQDPSEALDKNARVRKESYSVSGESIKSSLLSTRQYI